LDQPADRQRPDGEFELEFISSGHYFQFEIVLRGGIIAFERLHVRRKRRMTMLYERSDDQVKAGSGLRELSDQLRTVPAHIAIIGLLSSLREDTGMEVVNWFVQNLRLAEESNRLERWALTARLLHEERTAPLIRALLAKSSLGIEDVIVNELNDPDGAELDHLIGGWVNNAGSPFATPRFARPLPLRSMSLVHRGAKGLLTLSPEQESAGTRSWLGAVGIIVDSLLAGSVLLADEIETSLHPTLVRAVIELFQSATTNPNGAQLIANSHDISLLDGADDDRHLGRDQVWFCQRLTSDRLSIAPLSSYSPRKSEAIARRYLLGHYAGGHDNRALIEEFGVAMHQLGS
jgi:hypothetical protein